MLAPVFLLTLAASLALVRGDPGPTTPSPGAVYKEGAQCEIAWNADTTGTWKTMNIALMTGNNLQMVYLTTVATVDGTDANNASYSYPCPAVNPNSAIYFYEFSSPYSKSLYWTGRFAIATSDGQTTVPTESTVYDGETVAWGTGSVVGQTDAGSPPAYGESAAPSASAESSAASVSFVVSMSAGPSGTTVSLAPGWSQVPAVQPSSTDGVGPPVATVVTTVRGSNASPSGDAPGSASPVSTSPAGVAAAANAAPGHLKADSHVLRAVVALSIAAFTFAVAF